jgi:hypothetical protein
MTEGEFLTELLKTNFGWDEHVSIIRHPSPAAAASRALSEVEGVVEGSLTIILPRKSKMKYLVLIAMRILALLIGEQNSWRSFDSAATSAACSG